MELVKIFLLMALMGAITAASHRGGRRDVPDQPT